MDLPLDNISERCLMFYDEIKHPESLLYTPYNMDMGGVLSIVLSGYNIDLTKIQYEIIVLKTYNKLKSEVL